MENLDDLHFDKDVENWNTTLGAIKMVQTVWQYLNTHKQLTTPKFYFLGYTQLVWMHRYMVCVHMFTELQILECS